MTWTYRIGTGDLFHDGARIGRGYSGHPPYVNDARPEAWSRKDEGPIPPGAWTFVGAPYNSGQLGPFVLALEARPGTNTYGRCAFRVHGDKVGSVGEMLASHGCIILPRSVREVIWSSNDPDLLVVP